MSLLVFSKEGPSKQTKCDDIGLLKNSDAAQADKETFLQLGRKRWHFEGPNLVIEELEPLGLLLMFLFITILYYLILPD